MNDIKMIKIKLFLLGVVFSLTQICFGQWVNLNSEINDELTGVVFFEDTGIVSGKNGIYYTFNGGAGSTGWQRFEINDASLGCTYCRRIDIWWCNMLPYDESEVF